MKKVFSHENRLIVFNLKNVLQDAGIDCVVKNEFASGGVGDLSPFETWPELWVRDDADEARVLALIERAPQVGIDECEWFCASCGEKNPAGFQLCWQCGAPRQTD